MPSNSINNNGYENWSFTGIITIWALFSLYGDSFVFFLIDFTSYTPGYSYFQVLILKFLLLAAFPIGMIGLVSNFLPYQPIDYSRPAIIESLEHKLLFLCTSPCLYLGYLLANTVGSLTDSLIEPGFGFFTTGLVIWIAILGWIFFSLWFWEHLFGEDASITLQRWRTRVKDNQFGSHSTFSRVSFQPDYNYHHKSLWGKVSLRYFLFMGGLPIFIFMLGVIINPNFGFVYYLFSSVSLDLFACFFSFLLLKNYIDQQKGLRRFLHHLSVRLFGKKDIDSSSFIIGIIFLGVILFFSPLFVFLLPQGMIIIFYVLLVLIFIVLVWSNQVKALFCHMFPKRCMKDNYPKRILLSENK